MARMKQKRNAYCVVVGNLTRPLARTDRRLTAENAT